MRDPGHFVLVVAEVQDAAMRQLPELIDDAMIRLAGEFHRADELTAMTGLDPAPDVFEKLLRIADTSLNTQSIA